MAAPSCGPKQSIVSRKAGASEYEMDPDPTHAPHSRPDQPSQRASGTGSNDTESRRQENFCTHKCLRGLTHAGPLDTLCPNVSFHHGYNRCHSIDGKAFLKRLHQQLERDHDCQPLGLEGARGVFFRITLASHRYTLVAKGTAEDLKHEANVYQRLRELQGLFVPVCLGTLDPAKTYYRGIKIVHMLLLSWAGRRIDKVMPNSDEDHPDWKPLITPAITTIRDEGVRHKNANFLWDERVRRIMVVNFERSELVDKLPWVPSSRHKRKRVAGTEELESLAKRT